jgi:3'-phosphoadenosine 5'-phosphosulfate sulfotransferase (PAPS reductase)/FAD synthetase
VRIKTDSRRWREEHGLPSDIVPIGSTPTGLALSHVEGGTRPIVSRFQCCAENRTLPLAERLLGDKVTLMVCGTRRSDGGYGPILQGSTPGSHPNTRNVGHGVERFMPLLDWSGEDVFAYLRSVGHAPIASYYEGRTDYSAPVECKTCPSSWNTRWLRWLRENHPDIAAVVAEDQRALRAEIVGPLAKLRDSMAALDGL